MRISRTLAPLVAALLASCASVPANRGRDDVSAALAQRGQPIALPDADDRAAAEADVQSRLAQPLRIDDAVAIALARSPKVQVALATLDLAHADLVEASRPSNPGVTLSAQYSDEDGAKTKLGLSIVQAFGDLVLLKARTAIARGELDGAREDAVRAFQDLVADIESKYFALVGARQVAEMRAVVARAANASAAMARRYHDAGNLPALERDAQAAEASEAALEADRAAAEASAAYHALGAAMGVRPGEAWKIDARLPLPVAAEDEREPLATLANDSRADLAAARRRAEVLAESLGITRRFRWLGGFEVGIDAERETDGEKLVGPSVSFELPIFHRNEAAVARAEARVAQAEAEALALEGEIGHGVLASHAEVAAARRGVERHRDELVPLREAIVARTQERHDYMLTGVFELIEAKRAEYAAYESYLVSLRDYWQARAELAHVVGAALPSDATIAGTAEAGPVRLPEAAAPTGHEHHAPKTDPDPQPEPTHEHQHEEPTP